MRTLKSFILVLILVVAGLTACEKNYITEASEPSTWDQISVMVPPDSVLRIRLGQEGSNLALLCVPRGTQVGFDLTMNPPMLAGW